jgi:putative radical SAM enzyme (TIGR03279 family)
MKIVSVKKGSQAEFQGLKAGDKVVGVCNGPARDYIDLMYYGAEEDVRLRVHRGTYEFIVELKGEEDFGIEFEPMKIATCKNNCVFCFVKQNPPGMRKEIYVKDEDYRLSFLQGAYITLTGLDTNDLQRIVTQHLSPLYVSVHAIDTDVRMNLLGITKDDNMIENMDRLLQAGIKMHTQIVVCPGINDGDVLRKTICELRSRYPEVISVAVVPVGLTGHREGLYPLKRVDEEDARNVIEIVDRFHDQFAEETGGGFVFCADEWYIHAGLDIPDSEYYNDFPQVENGVGMLRKFLDAVSNLSERLNGKIKRTGNFVLVTGTSMSSYIEDFTGRISEFPGIGARTVTVNNRFYGDSITVSGLLTGKDIQSALENNVNTDEIVVLPPNCLNHSGVFLDDTSPADISEALGIKIIQGDYDPVKLFV